MKKFLSFFVLLIFSFEARAHELPKSYRRHFIIVVDQGGCQNHENMPKLYNDLVFLFDKGSLPDDQGLSTESQVQEGFRFDPLLDEITIYGSGISFNDFSFFYNQCQNGEISTNALNDSIVSRLFETKPSFQSIRETSELTINEYFQQYLYPLTNGQSQKHQNIRVGLNEYLYPLILKKINTTIPAEEYYIIRISNFTSQGALQQVKNQQLIPMLANNEKYVDGYDSFINSIKKPYYEVPFLTIIRRTGSGPSWTQNSNNNPKVLGYRLNLVSLQSVGVRSISMPNFNQIKYGGNVFNFNQSIIQFTHDNHIKIQDIYWRVHGEGFDNCLEINSKYCYDSVKSEYNFPKGSMQIGKIPSDSIIKMEHIFYTQSYDDDKKPLLPMVFKADGQYKLSKADFKPKPIDNHNWKIALAICLPLIGLLVFFLIKRRIKRGRDRKVWVDYEIGPVSQSRYMEVKDNKVVSLDCWYVNDDNLNQAITVKGRLQLEHLRFCKKFHYRLEYQVVDEDSENDFSFRPDGEDNQGQPLKKDQWYKVDNLNNKGEFKFNILTYIDLDHSPNLIHSEERKKLFNDNEHPYRLLKTNVNFRVLVLDPNKRDTDFDLLVLPNNNDNFNELQCFVKRIEIPKHPYEFIARPDFERKAAWVAFDPGTTGSCAAFTWSQNQWDPITLAKVKMTHTETQDDMKETSCVFPSVVNITDRARCFKQDDEVVESVEDWEIDKDFIFGNAAEIRLGSNRFRSIKKLLGYKDLLEIETDTGSKNYPKVVKRKISGKDLATLLVKGLYKQVGDFAMNDSSIDEYTRENISDKFGHFAPTRAIVAVPNNYTMLKIQEMVDSVKRLGCFEEVHFIYESEGVMMNYLNKRWQNLNENDNKKTYVVYDMGGATINATAFNIKIEKGNNGNINKITVNTISKVGYCVGGDDIDYALIRMLFDIPTVSEKLGNDEDRKKTIMKQNKQKLIRFVTGLKLELIDKERGNTGMLRILANDENMINGIIAVLKECDIQLEYDNFTVEDRKFINRQLEKQNSSKSIMYKFVYSKIEDAINELMKDLHKGNIELILSGRSSLYPHVQEYVTKTMESNGFTPIIWDGFNDANGNLDADAVKTAVAAGACWYAQFNTMIRLNHSLITSSFGFIDQIENKPKFIPVINRLDEFVDGKKTNKTNVNDIYSKKLSFIQMLGSDHDKILKDYSHNKNYHKINVLDIVPGEIINGPIESVSITIEDNNNFRYDVKTSVGHITTESNRYSRLAGVKTEIAQENNESFVFATLQSNDEKF